MQQSSQSPQESEQQAKTSQYQYSFFLFILQAVAVAIVLFLLISSTKLNWSQGLGLIVLLCLPMIGFFIGIRQAHTINEQIKIDEVSTTNTFISNPKKHIPSVQELVDSLPIAAIISNVVDDKWQVLAYNKHVQKICSQSVEKSLLSHEYAPLRQAELEQLIHLNIIDMRGNRRDLLGYCSPVFMTLTYANLYLLIDSTAYESNRHAREEIWRAGALSTLSASITHDFRNILTGMIGYAELLEMEIEDATQREFVQLIIQAGDQASLLMDQMMQVSRAHSTEHTSIDIHTPIQNAIEQTRLALPDTVNLSININESLPSVMANSLQLEYCILQLLNNALRAINKYGSIQLLVFADSKHTLAQKEKPAIHIQVCDNGCGIADADMDNIFNLFWHKFSNNNNIQAGLGLAIIKRIVRWHHGVVSVESNKDAKGVTLHIILPAADNVCIVDTGTSSSSPKISSDATDTTSTTTINKPLEVLEVLIVDDNEDVRNVHSSLFQRMGHIVSTATDGTAALQMLDAQPTRFHMVATDFRMPKMDGLELILNMNRHGYSIPTLMLTGFGEDAALRCLRSLDVELLVKPISFKRLQSAINDLQQRVPSLQENEFNNN